MPEAVKVSGGGDPQLLKTIQSLDIHGGRFDSTAEANKAYQHDVCPDAAERVFNFPKQVLSASDTIRFSKEGISGVSSSDGKLMPSSMHRPLACVDVRFIRCKKGRWNIPGGSAMYQPLQASDDGVLLPLLGGIYVNGEDITKDEAKMGRLGMSFAKDGEGRDVKYPAFVSGGRSILLFGSFNLPTFITAEGGRALMRFDELQTLLKKRFGGDYPAFESALERRLRSDWEAKGEGLGWDEFRRRRWEAEYFGTVVGAHSEGERKTTELIPAVAVQYKGVGVAKYAYHAVRRNADGSADLKPGEVVLKVREHEQPEDFALVQRTHYEGKAGIFLDVHHEYFDKSPTGGIYSEQKGLERDEALMASGARMSGVNLGYSRLLTRAEVKDGCGGEMVCEEIVVAHRAILDDTHRLTALTRPLDRTAKPTFEFNYLMVRDYGAYSDEARDRYLGLLSDNVGHNLKICLGLDLTVAKEQNSADNLSIYGRIIDSQSFMDMKSRYQCGTLIRNWLQDTINTAESAGLDMEHYLKSGHFRKLATNLLGEGGGNAVADDVGRQKGKAEIGSFALRLLGREWVKKSMEADGAELSDRGLFKALKESEKFREYAGVSAKSIPHVKMLLEGKAMSLTVTSESRYGGGMPEYYGRSDYFAMLRDKYIEYELARDQPIIEHGLDQSGRRISPLIAETKARK